MFAQNVLFFQATKVSNRITKCKYFIKILWGPSISDLGFWILVRQTEIPNLIESFLKD